MTKSDKAPASANPPQNALNHLYALYEQGRLTDLLNVGGNLADDFPESAVLHNILGAANAVLNREESAIACYRRAIELKSDFAAAHNNLGNLLRNAGLLDEAVSSFQAALHIKPDFAEAHNNLGNVLQDMGASDEALASYKRATELKPNYAEAHYNLGVALKKKRASQKAVECFKRATALKPDYAEAFNSLGNLLAEEGALEAAEACYRRALTIKPDYIEACNNLALMLEEKGARDEAIAWFDRALEINPQLSGALAEKLHLKAKNCDWSLWPEFEKATRLNSFVGESIAPFPLLALEDEPARHRSRAELFAREHTVRTPPRTLTRPLKRPSKLNVAYFSADFRAHAVMHLIAGLFRAHDRENIRVFAYSYGPDTKDGVRDQVIRDVDCFRDVRSIPDQEIAELARRDRIDIAVDLQGYTAHSRLEVFAYRPAPVQINYLGYPGTLGAGFIDYIVADEILIPAQQRQHYSENIIYLPNSFMVNDDTRAISQKKMSRKDFGLPEEAFVFCCFNSHYKISPAEFDIWMRLLDSIDGSVLWLKSNHWAETNLCREAEARGVRSERIIFAEGVDRYDEHLARHALADVFLDTFNYNAHTTASDALWAGLPLITKAGKGFASRVCASLLNAVGLPQLITETAEDYEALALQLATHREDLRAVRQQLAENIRTKPLFDTEQFARHIEAAYQQAYDLYFEGKNPQTIYVAD